MTHKQVQQQPIYSLRLHCTNLCNQRCDYCHVYKHGNGSPPIPKLMDFNIGRRAIDALDRITSENENAHISIGMYGGEPLLNWKMLKKLIHYGNRILNGGRKVAWKLNTNGTLISQAIADVLKDEKVDVHLSIDGPDILSNRYRRYKSGRSVLTRVMDAIDILTDTGCKLQFDACLTGANLYGLKNLVDLAADSQADRIYLALTDTAVEFTTEPVNIKVIAEKIIEAMAYADQRGVYLGGPWKRAILGGLGIPHSQSPVSYLIVDPAGKIHYPPISQKPLGTVDGLENIASTPEYHSVMTDWDIQRVKCGGCDLEHTCNGYLKAMVMYHTGDTGGYQRQCNLALSIANALTGVPAESPGAVVEDKLTLSRQLIYRRVGGNGAIIHRLSGTAIAASTDLLALLNRFKEPASAWSVVKHYDQKDIRAIIARLMDMHFLVSETFDEEFVWMNDQTGQKQKSKLNTDHFMTFCPDDSLTLAMELMQILEELHLHLVTRGMPPLKKAAILAMCGSREEFGRFWGDAKLPAWPKAFVTRGRILVVDIAKTERLDRTETGFQRGLLHELVHLCLNQSSWQLPVWLEEGLCEYFSQPYNQLEFMRMARKKGIYGIRELEIFAEHSLLDLDDSPVVENICYRQSHSFVHYLASLMGHAKLMKCIQKTELGKDFGSNFQEDYGRSLSGIEDEWLETVRPPETVKDDIPDLHRNLKTTPNLRSIRNESKVLFYDSRSGQSLIGTPDLTELLQLFENGARIRDLEKEYEISNLEEIVSGLYHKGLLVFDHVTDNGWVVRRLDKHKVKSGALINALRLNVSTLCNMSCTYCYVDRERPNAALMEFNVARKALEVFFDLQKRHCHSESTIRFFGGEPLLNWPVIKKVFDYVEESEFNNKVNYVLNTNGTIINDIIAAALHAHGVSVNISLDGIGDVNDNHRRYRSGRGSFKTIDRNLDTFLAHGCQVIVEATLGNHNEAHIKGLIDYLQHKGAAFGRKIPLALQSLCMLSRNDRHRSSVAKRVKWVEKAVAYSKAKDVRIDQGMIFFPFRVITGHRNPGVYCRGMGEELCVYPTGDIYPCGALNVKLGSVHEIEDVFRSEAYGNIVRRVAGKIPACRGCEIEAFCAGGCAADAYTLGGDIFSAGGNCAFEKALFRSLVNKFLLN